MTKTYIDPITSIRTRDHAAEVTDRGPGGQYTEYFMRAVSTATGPSGASQIWSSTAGATAIQVSMLDTPGAGEVVIVGFSETAADSVAVIAAIDAALADAVIPDGAAHTGIFTITVGSLGLSSGWIFANDAIRTVVAKTDDGDVRDYVLRAVSEA